MESQFEEERDGFRGRVRRRSVEEKRRIGSTRLLLLLLLLISSDLDDNKVLLQALFDDTDLAGKHLNIRTKVNASVLSTHAGIAEAMVHITLRDEARLRGWMKGRGTA